jgi:NAD(P)-dependent dehydrogenase (short-subunit alcohol dehydrogenase family)
LTSSENTRRELAEKVAVVTGGTRGIGRAIAEELSLRGARVAVIGRDAATAAAVASDLPGEAIGVAVDLSHPDGPAAMVHEVALELGPIQLLVNNAGIGKPSLEVERGEWQTLLDVNLTAVFFCSTAVAAAMPPEGGAIVNISSVAGLAGIPERAAYCATKAAVVGLTRELGVE